MKTDCEHNNFSENQDGDRVCLDCGLEVAGEDNPEPERHTTGPWRLTDHSNDDPTRDGHNWPPYWFIDAGSGSVLQDGFHLSGYLRTPDARLIAAAPDLLVACERVIREIDNDHDGHGISIGAEEDLRAAIRKAEEENG